MHAGCCFWPCRQRFSATCLKLVGVALLCGVFTGLRGGLFSLTTWRLNVRIRSELFSSLLAQEIGFFDKVKTGWPDRGDGSSAGCAALIMS